MYAIKLMPYAKRQNGRNPGIDRDGDYSIQVLVDGHVHFHRCFSWDTFLCAAERNFSAARTLLGLRESTPFCILMTESSDANAYHDLRDGRVRVSGRQIQLGREAESIEVILNEQGDRLLVIAGRQIVTDDGLEVHAIGHEGMIPDGYSTRATLEAVRECGAVPVIPWGPGKWTGRRARILDDIIATHINNAVQEPLLLGDNGNRLRGTSRPAIFTRAESAGIPTIPGTDQLPMCRHEGRVGSYGFVLGSWPEKGLPAKTMRARLRTLNTSPQSYGALASLPRFVRDQFAMQWRKRIAIST